MEYTPPPKPQLSSRANAFSIAALMSSGSSKDKESPESTIKPLGELGMGVTAGVGGGRRAHPPPSSGSRGRQRRVPPLAHRFPLQKEKKKTPTPKPPKLKQKKTKTARRKPVNSPRYPPSFSGEAVYDLNHFLNSSGLSDAVYLSSFAIRSITSHPKLVTFLFAGVK